MLFHFFFLPEYNLTNFKLIGAKVPILRFNQDKIVIDLNFNNPVGVFNTHLLFSYAQMDWRVAPLVLIVKLWAKHFDINDPLYSTFSSYSLTLMTIYYLQRGVKVPLLPCLQDLYPERFSHSRRVCDIDINEDIPPHPNDNEDTLGELFINFLQFYSRFEYVNLMFTPFVRGYYQYILLSFF